MPAYKDSKTGTWFVKFYCKDWTGENKQIKKRGFATKREALDYERNYKIRQENNLDMTFGEFWKLYTEDVKNYVKLNTWLTKEHIVDLIDLGFSAVAIADRVGHESIDITYRYSHLFPSKQVAMADRLDAVNASFEDCEEQDDDVEIMQTEETAPMIDMDAAAEKIISIDKYKAV